MPEVLSATQPRPAINVFVLFPLQKKKKSETLKLSAFNLHICIDVALDRRQTLWSLEQSRFLQYKEIFERDPFNQNANRSDREKWSTSKGGLVFSKLFRSIEFWTEISGNFGWMDRALYVWVDKSWSVALKNKDVRESGLWNAVFLESGLQLKESGIALATGIRNPKLHRQNLESNTWNPEQKKKGSNR